MNIQIIGSFWGRNSGFDGVVQSALSNPRSLDEFDVNVIDLSCENMWYNDGSSKTEINELNNLYSVQQMVSNSVATKIVYVLPQNIALKYNVLGGKYRESVMIKDHLEDIRKKIIAQVFCPPLPFGMLLFENTRTEIDGIEYEADFYFKNGMKAETKSKLSNKITTISLGDRVLATALNITSSGEKLMHFLNFFYAVDEVGDCPEWFTDIDFHDDRLQKEIISEREAEIARAKQAIEEANSRLQKNEQYKSVLFTNSTALVRVVFDILEHLLGCDLSEFEDKKNEDFLIRLDGCTLIGEIKGVTSNVKNDHVGQIEHHYQRYIDQLEEEGREEKVHQVLIINPFRTKAPDVREPVNDKQINLAKRNGCLIIETHTLLKIFGLYLAGEVTSEQCVDVFCNQIGLLQVSDVLTKTNSTEDL